jgi:hypothetical protein
MDKVFRNYLRDKNDVKWGTRNDTLGLCAVMKRFLIELNICPALNKEYIRKRRDKLHCLAERRA